MILKFNYLCFSPAALTHDNVLKELKDVNWKTLCDKHKVHGKTFAGILELPRSQGRRIEQLYVSEEEKKSKGVLFWLNNHPDASWRFLIVMLDHFNANITDSQIRQYAERVKGMLNNYLARIG